MLPLPITDIVIRRRADDGVSEVLKAYVSVTFGGTVRLTSGAVLRKL